MNVIKGFLFDFDGLIVDTEVPEYTAWCEIYNHFGTDLPLAEWARTIGTQGVFDPVENLERRIGKQVDREALIETKQKRSMSLIALQPILPGVNDYIDYAKKHDIRIGLASSSSREWVHGNLARVGLVEKFECIFTSTEVPQVKPRPDLYLAALDALQLRPEEAIVFEDSPNGILAAKSAGIRCVAIPNALTRYLDTSRADLILNSLADIDPDQLIQRFN
jgi:HAD superfamily hydrolase (TIGR01509 family)